MLIFVDGGFIFYSGSVSMYLIFGFVLIVRWYVCVSLICD